MSTYKPKHEEKILRGLIQNFAYREDLIDHLRSVTEEGTVKLMFPSKGKNAFTTNSLIAKARSISYEALANHIPAFLPEPKPKPEGEKKKTLSEQRAEMFAGFTKMSAKQLKDEKVQKAIAKAKEMLETRKKTGAKIKETAAKKKAEAAAKAEEAKSKSAKSGKAA